MTPLTEWEKAECQHELTHLVNTTSGVEAALLASPDGFELVSATRSRRIDGPRLAAMSSSMLALGSAMANDLGLDACRNMHIEAGDGVVLLFTVPYARSGLVLSALAPKGATLGMMLVATRACVRAIAHRLDASGPSTKGGLQDSSAIRR